MIEFSPRTAKLLSDSFSIPYHELPRTLFHGIILSFIISSFWLLDSLKDPVLAQTTGIEYQPIAKFISVIATLIIVSIYDYFTSIVSKITLFHLISWIYGIDFLIFSSILSNSNYGLSSKSHGPHRFIGWLCYFTIESYGSLMVSLFWSFTNSIMNFEQAKGSYGLIIAIAQLGAIFGSTVATHANKIGISLLFLMASLSIISVSLLIKLYCIIFTDQHTTRIMKNNPYLSFSESRLTEPFSIESDIDLYSTKHFQIEIKKFFNGFFEGLTLILNYSYTQKILGVSCLYEIIVTVLDYQFKIIGAKNSYNLTSNKIDEIKFTHLLGNFGQFTNFISLIVSIFCFTFLLKSVDIKFALLIFPIILFFSILLIFLHPTLLVLFMTMSLIKGLIFSLHDPMKEILYIPTSSNIKFQGKAWIDVFGSRLAKGIGSLITNYGSNYTEIPCLLLSISIILVSWYVGIEFQELIVNDQIIGETVNTQNLYTNIKQYDNLPIRNGLIPGDVGYDGYDLHLFEGVFPDDDENSNKI